jgi:hypothetical protein
MVAFGMFVETDRLIVASIAGIAPGIVVLSGAWVSRAAAVVGTPPKA